MSGLVLSAWSAVSPFGVGSDPFRAGIKAGRSAVGELDREQFPGPFGRCGMVPDFTAVEYVGKKGTRTMDRVTAIAVTAVGRLLDACDDSLTARPEQIGLVLGTGSGSVQSIMDFTRDSLVGERPYHVDPSRFPNTVMNRAAGQSAIWHGIKGPNTTIAGGWLTGLLALSYAVRLHRGGHCARVLCGAAEEYSAQRAWLEWHGRSEEERATPLGEGSAVFLLETAADAQEAGRVPLAGLLATRFRAYGEPGGAREALAECVRDALRTADVRPEDIRLVAPLGAGGEWAALEEAGIADALGEVGPTWVRCRPLLGDTSAASTSLQLAAVLAAAGERGLAPGEAALVTGVERDGTVGCAVLGGGL
ncbi:beta-ketoacyl synthase N-terminal-like domain-containing protein [Streptomyces sp. st77]|uniref:beta-ketoacyl synthase N-terminal-like domain-containing protein n=1 Tax=Streptomyces sp. st77 TaxID=1828074 RepID=UPI000BFDBE3A|nr:beta-ketoacyl synthase N-terminal-like domain-containing protein [Streptomyces sp. st77]